MKWKEFESKHPKDLYTKVKQLCEGIHDESGFFCNYCYKREGWCCFPCNGIKKLREERHGEPLDKTRSNQS